MENIIVIGAGAAGLMAARMLSRAGKQVTVLEARDRTGGRINTVQLPGFTRPVETGAEFIHGELPRTKKLVQEAGATLRKGGGKSWKVEKGMRTEGDTFETGWDAFTEALHALDHDMSIAEFLDTRFAGHEYRQLRESVTRFVEGFDAADATLASAFALRDEWSDEEALTGYHIEQGYSFLLDFLKEECLAHNVVFHFSSPVKTIHWQAGKVTVSNDAGKTFIAEQVLVTIPPAVLKTGSITFSPALGVHQDALSKIETGGVIKFVVEFTDADWEMNTSGLREFPGMHFLFTDAQIPTWWSQKPSSFPLLTGWLSGPVTAAVSKTEAEWQQEAITALAYIFDCPEETLRPRIRAIHVINWLTDPFARGAYAYKTLHTSQAVQCLAQPIDHTLFFAGEAYYEGPEMGTVEAALASGEQRAQQMLG